MRMIRAVKTGLLVTFITASGIAVAQDEAPPPPQFSTQDQAGPQGAAPQDRGPQIADQNAAPPQDNQGWRRLGPAYPQNGGDPQQGAIDPRYAQASSATACEYPAATHHRARNFLDGAREPIAFLRSQPGWRRVFRFSG